MKAGALALMAGLLVAGCGPTAVPRPQPIAAAPPPPRYTTAGLERVMGQSARAVTSLLGTPAIDQQEGTGRKLQFASGICVLDTYLYQAQGGREPVVTHVDARQRDGAPIDRASCVAALVRRDGGK